MKVEQSHIEPRPTKIIDSVEYFCDKCGEKLKVSRSLEDSYKIVFKTGSSSPSGGYYQGVQAFFCEKCSIIIKSLLEKNGVKFEEIEEDW